MQENGSVELTNKESSILTIEFEELNLYFQLLIDKGTDLSCDKKLILVNFLFYIILCEIFFLFY